MIRLPPTIPASLSCVTPTNVLLLDDDAGAMPTAACDDDDDDVVEEDNAIVVVVNNWSKTTTGRLCPYFQSHVVRQKIKHPHPPTAGIYVETNLRRPTWGEGEVGGFSS